MLSITLFLINVFREDQLCKLLNELRLKFSADHRLSFSGPLQEPLEPISHQFVLKIFLTICCQKLAENLDFCNLINSSLFCPADLWPVSPILYSEYRTALCDFDKTINIVILASKKRRRASTSSSSSSSSSSESSDSEPRKEKKQAGYDPIAILKNQKRMVNKTHINFLQ